MIYYLGNLCFQRRDKGSMCNLRKALSELVKNPNVEHHVSEINKLREKFNHKIEVISITPERRKNFICTEFVFDLIEDSKYQQLKSRVRSKKFVGDPDLAADLRFVTWLLENNFMPEGNSIVLYFD